jgi:drug/metabolite transporter (DMT)-like permease
LVVFNALIAFSAFHWLLKIQPAVKVATYAYVNPVVALWLGWWVLNETPSAATLAASCLVLASVALLLHEAPVDAHL